MPAAPRCFCQMTSPRSSSRNRSWRMAIDVRRERPVRPAAEVGDVHGDATAGLERADALGEHLGEHLEVLQVGPGHVALPQRLLVLLAREVRGRGDHQGHGAVGHLAHGTGVPAEHVVQGPLRLAGRSRLLRGGDVRSGEAGVELRRVVALPLGHAERRGGRGRGPATLPGGTGAVRCGGRAGHGRILRGRTDSERAGPARRPAASARRRPVGRLSSAGPGRGCGTRRWPAACRAWWRPSACRRC